MKLPERIECNIEELAQILGRLIMTDEDRATLHAAVETLAFLTVQLERKRVNVQRLKNALFGVSTEKTSHVLGLKPAAVDRAAHASDGQSDDARGGGQSPRRKGHGRLGVRAYGGAPVIAVVLGSLSAGDRCPSCEAGDLYGVNPKRVLRIRGCAPIMGNVYELGRLRCKTCGKLFTAEPPDEMGQEKYDVTAAVMIAVLKYGMGLPFNRLASLQKAVSLPLAPATQWDIVHRRLTGPEAAYQQLVRQAAQAPLLHNDDTYATLLGAVRRRDVDENKPSDSGQDSDRTGTFTTGIVAVDEGRELVLFFTGHQHAGENLRDLLRHRAAGLAPPLHMCDALSRNLPKEFETILCNCLAHARRSFVELTPRFREECRYVLETLGDVYRNDELAHQRAMSPEQRLAWHQGHSGPLMNGLKEWFKEQFEQKRIEPNSTLGDAIEFMQKHWDALTQFLRVAGAPLDNNLVERALKRAILHRKNALFFRTERGAHVADIYMSLIHTAQSCGANPIEYVRALMNNAELVSAQPAEWMPWNYEQTLAAAA